eukprot:TRINITY_DN5588_c0_g1_i2.p1 TRINITY_DN5588_c0_g1~~TRINITY_DN5588_c0_g1_i2.p1  ORF type:complete len:277 (+),score=74.68 TRINITY_DN5588_c0_g1_i2:111-833(+)
MARGSSGLATPDAKRQRVFAARVDPNSLQPAAAAPAERKRRRSPSRGDVAGLQAAIAELQLGPKRPRRQSADLHRHCRCGDAGALDAALRGLAAQGSQAVAAALSEQCFRHHFGGSPLHAAARSGSAACVRLLLRYGADPTLRDEDGEAPQELCDYDDVRRLFEPPLHNAVARADLAAIRQLLREQPEAARQTDWLGQSAADYALRLPRPSGAAVLRLLGLGPAGDPRCETAALPMSEGG